MDVAGTTVPLPPAAKPSSFPRARLWPQHSDDLPWIAALLAINAAVLANALVHSPAVGYDASAHLKYIEVLSQLRLPSPSDTPEFFSPPLPYLVPALLRAIGAVSQAAAGKVAQLLNVLYSVGLTLCVVRLCDRLRPRDPHLKLAALLCLGMLPVYYKSFAFVRGEPLLALLALVVVDRALSTAFGDRGTSRDALLMGGSLGLAIVSRQWGFLLLPPLLAFAAILMARRIIPWRQVLTGIVANLLVAAVAGGWFYAYQQRASGSFAAFNRAPSPSMSPSDLSRKLDVGGALPVLFTDPVRRNLRDAYLPIFYTEIWGDYWAYFAVRGKDLRNGKLLCGPALQGALSVRPVPAWLETNRLEIGAYLGRNNLVSLLPSAILLGGLLLGAARLAAFISHPAPGKTEGIPSLLFLVVAGSLAGYAAFLLVFSKSDAVKATYMLQVFPPAAILAGELLRVVRERSVTGYRLALAALAAAALHSAPLFLTHYVRTD